MTPLGHAAIGYIAGRGLPRWPMAPLLVGSILPDVDFAAGLFGQANDFHRGATHSIAFAVLAGVVAAIWGWRDRAGWAIAAFTGVLAHAVIDSMLDTNPSNGIGVALFWPIDREPVSLFNLAPMTCDGWQNPLAALSCSWSMVAFELPFLLWAGIMFVRSRRLQR